MSSKDLRDDPEAIIEPKFPGSLYPSVDASGQLSGIVPFSIKMEDKWTMVSFLSLGGSIKKSVNVENLTKTVVSHPAETNCVWYHRWYQNWEYSQ
jgi:hypothetical protein